LTLQGPGGRLKVGMRETFDRSPVGEHRNVKSEKKEFVGWMPPLGCGDGEPEPCFFFNVSMSSWLGRLKVVSGKSFILFGLKPGVLLLFS